MDDSPATNCRRCAAPLTPGLPGVLCGACVGADLFSGGEDPPAVARVGDYELMEELGRGGMGVVYRARQISLNRPAAVKLILTGPLASSLERQRFVAEAEAAAALDHPGIVSIYEAGEDDGQPFFAMQYIEGESLAARLRHTDSLLPARVAAQLILRMAQAVQHAHERGFLHRDLKPGNILLSSDGEPHVTDFGLARRMDSDAHLTLTGAAVGTPSYMAPEQTDTRQPPTTAVDVYSLGAILYELLSGQPPFKADSLPALFMAICGKEPVSITAVRPGVDRDLDVICRKCLEKEPLRRYRTAQALADDIQRWLDGESITARAAGLPERFWRWCRRRPAIAGLAAAAAVFFLSGLTGIVWQWRRANKEADTAVAALHRAEESLWQANVSEARARRSSRERGQRLESLRSLKAAAEHRVTIALRNEAIAAMTFPDLSEPQFFSELPAGTKDVRTDRNAGRIAFLAADGALHLRALEADADAAVMAMPDLTSFTADTALQYFVLLGARTPDGQRAELWSVASGTAEKKREWEAVNCAAFSPDGKSLLLHRGGGLELLAAPGGEVLQMADCPQAIAGAEISPDGKRAVLFGHNTNQAELWSLDPPGRIRMLPRLPDVIYSMRWHPQDDVLFVASGRQAWRLRLPSDRAGLLASHEREGVFLELHPQDNCAVTTSWDGVVKFSIPGIGQELLRTAGFRPVGFSADGKRLVVNSGKRAGVCQVAPLRAWRVIPPPADGDSAWTSVEFSPDSRLLAAVRREGVSFYDPVSFTCRAAVPLNQGMSGAWLPDGSLLVSNEREGISKITLSAGDGPLTANRSLLLRSKSAEAQFGWLHTSGDGNGVIVAGQGAAAVYDLERKSTLSIITEQPMLSRAVWSPDRKWVATGYWNNRVSGGAGAHVFTPDGKLVQKLPAGSCAPAFTPDGRRLILGSTHEYVEWDTATWRELRRHPREASGLDMGLSAFSAAANLMVLQASETVLRLLKLDTGEEFARLEQPAPQKINLMALSPDGRWLAVQMQQSLRVWDLQAVRAELRELGLDWHD